MEKKECKINFQYQPIFKDKVAFIMNVPEVHEGYEDFTTQRVDYEIRDKDLQFMKLAGLKITPDEFEKAIDSFEKICKMVKNENFKVIMSHWARLANAKDYKGLTEDVLDNIYMNHWKPEKEKTKRSFLRIFWEKADYDDNNNNSAFRRR